MDDDMVDCSNAGNGNGSDNNESDRGLDANKDNGNGSDNNESDTEEDDEEENGNGSDNNESDTEEDENGGSRSNSSGRGRSSSRSSDGSRRSSPGSSSPGSSSEDESEHKPVENEDQSEEMNAERSGRNETDDGDEQEVERSGRNETDDGDEQEVEITDSEDEPEVEITGSEDEPEVKITDSDDEQEVEIIDSDNGKEDVNAESKGERKESIDDEEDKDMKIVDYFEDRDVNIDGMVVDGERHGGGDHIETKGKDEIPAHGDEDLIELKVENEIDGDGDHMETEDGDGDHMETEDGDGDGDHMETEDGDGDGDGDHMETEDGDGDDLMEEAPMGMAYDEREEGEASGMDLIDVEEDETIDPSYYDFHFKPARHDVEAIHPRGKRPIEEVKVKTREHVRRLEKNDKQHGIPHENKPKESIKINKTEGEQEKKSLQKGPESSMKAEMIKETNKSIKIPSRDAAVKFVTSTQGPPMKTEMIKETNESIKIPSRDAAVKFVTSDQRPPMKTEMIKETNKPIERLVETQNMEIPTKAAVGLFANPVTTQEGLSVKTENKETKKINKGLEKKKEPNKPRGPLKSLPENMQPRELAGRSVFTITKQRGFSKDEKEQPKKPSNVAVEISTHRSLQASAEKKANETRPDEGKDQREDVRKESEKEPKNPRKGEVGIPKKEIPQSSKAEGKPNEKKTDQPRGLKKLEKDPRKVPEKQNVPKHREEPSAGPFVKTSTSKEAGPSRKPETHKEPKKSQSIPKKRSHKDGSSISQPEVENPIQAMETDEELQHKDLNPLHNEVGEVRNPMDVYEQETRGGGREPSLEQGEIEGSPGEKPKTDLKVHREEAVSGEKPKTNNKGKRIKVPPTDCGDDCYKKYQKDVPDRWELVTNMETFHQYVQEFQMRYACYSLIREQLSTTIKIFEELRELVEDAKRKDIQIGLNVLKNGVNTEYQKERTTYFQRKKAYMVLHKELDNLRAHILKFYQENARR